MKKLRLIQIIMIFMLSSCIRWEGPQTTMSDDIAKGSPDFQQGWYDGCEVGRETGSKSIYKFSTKTNKVDGYKIADSADYRTAWNYAFWYCYRDDYVDQKNTPWNQLFGGFQ